MGVKTTPPRARISPPQRACGKKRVKQYSSGLALKPIVLQQIQYPAFYGFLTSEPPQSPKSPRNTLTPAHPTPSRIQS